MSMLDRLAATLPEGALITDPDIVERYRRDTAANPGAGTPLAVVRATATADVQQVLRWASEHGIAVVPRGAGSGLSGGADAVDERLEQRLGAVAAALLERRVRGLGRPAVERAADDDAVGTGPAD